MYHNIRYSYTYNKYECVLNFKALLKELKYLKESCKIEHFGEKRIPLNTYKMDYAEVNVLKNLGKHMKLLQLRYLNNMIIHK